MLNFDHYKKNFYSFREDYLYSKPFKHILIDNFLPEDICEKVYGEIKNNEYEWTPFKANSLVKKHAYYNLNEMKHYTKTLINELNSNEFLECLKILTGENLISDPTLEGGGLHFILKGGYLNIHTDFQSHIINKTWSRRLNLLLYFNKGWTEKNNGNIELWDKDMKNKFLSSVPEYNRCLIFCTESPSNHGHPEPCKPPDGDFRKSIALYYYREEGKVQKLIATQFVSRKTDNLVKKISTKISQQILNSYSYLKRKGFVNDGMLKVFNTFNKNKKH